MQKPFPFNEKGRSEFQIPGLQFPITTAEDAVNALNTVNRAGNVYDLDN